MEEAAELGNYLPLSFKSPKEQEYIAFLWDAFETNTTHGKYQFALLAYHMLTMSFVYFNIWRIKQTRLADFEKGLIGFARDEKVLFEATSPRFRVRMRESQIKIQGQHACFCRAQVNCVHRNQGQWRSVAPRRYLGRRQNHE